MLNLNPRFINNRMDSHHFNQQGYYYPPNTKFQSQEQIQQPLTGENKMYELRNFVGMMLEELRYSVEVLKQQIYNDKNAIIDGFRQAAFSLRELGEKLSETELEANNQHSVHSQQFFQLVQENQNLNREIQRLKLLLNDTTKSCNDQIEKIKQESYQTFEDNFVLNQKIANLETELETKTSEVVDDLKREHQISTEVLNHQISVLEETIKERDESIGILQRLVKDYELIHDRKSVHQQNDNSKVLNMLSMESHELRRNDMLRTDGYKQSGIRQKYEIKREQPKRYVPTHLGEFRSLDNSGYASIQSPSHNNNSGYMPSFNNYRMNTFENVHPISHQNNHSTSGSRSPHPITTQIHYPNENSYPSRPDPYYTPGQYSTQQSPLFPPRLTGSRVGSRNQQSSFSYTNYLTSGHQTPVAKIKDDDRDREKNRIMDRGDRKQPRGDIKRQTSRESRHNQTRENKVDLAKIEQELEGLAKQLKSELASISKKKI